jgi:hypothetical protein
MSALLLKADIPRRHHDVGLGQQRTSADSFDKLSTSGSKTFSDIPTTTETPGASGRSFASQWQSSRCNSTSRIRDGSDRAELAASEKAPFG